MSEFWFDGTKAEMVAEWARENDYLLASPEHAAQVREFVASQECRLHWIENSNEATHDSCPRCIVLALLDAPKEEER